MVAAMNDETASFGFKDVPKGEKASRVRAVFDSVATRYDLMNDAMSAGLHRLWKDAAAAKLNPQPGELILDVAGGTGDIARRLKKLGDGAARRRGLEPPEIHVLDINTEMLEAGRAKGEDGLSWHEGDAEHLLSMTAPPTPTSQLRHPQLHRHPRLARPSARCVPAGATALSFAPAIGELGRYDFYSLTRYRLGKAARQILSLSGGIDPQISG